MSSSSKTFHRSGWNFGGRASWMRRAQTRKCLDCIHLLCCWRTSPNFLFKGLLYCASYISTDTRFKIFCLKLYIEAKHIAISLFSQANQPDSALEDKEAEEDEDFDKFRCFWVDSSRAFSAEFSCLFRGRRGGPILCWRSGRGLLVVSITAFWRHNFGDLIQGAFWDEERSPSAPLHPEIVRSSPPTIQLLTVMKLHESWPGEFKVTQLKSWNCTKPQRLTNLNAST